MYIKQAEHYKFAVFSLLQFLIDCYEKNENVHAVTDLNLNKKHVLNKKKTYNNCSLKH